MKNSLHKECPFLVILIIIFWTGCSFSFLWAAMNGQLNTEYLKKHADTPFWEDCYQIIDDIVRPYQYTQVAGVEITEEEPVQEPVAEPQPVEVPEITLEETTPVGITDFVEYEPLPVESVYYQDTGLRPLTTDYPYEDITEDEMSDACFIGDSRTVGIFDYCDLEHIADFYCDTGHSMYDWDKGEKITYRATGQKVDLLEEMSQHQYGKIYIMMGINDLGYVDTSTFADRIGRLYNAIRAQQPDATVYLMANMYMSKEKCGTDPVFNNVNVNDKNVQMARLADGVHSFYLDANPLYLDEEGFLSDDYTFDGCHVYGNLYGPWKAFILSHVVK